MKTNKLIEKTKGYFTKSFTLIELIVVIVVIGVLSAIVVPNISSFKDEAKETAMLSDGKNLQTAVDMYQLDNHGDFPVLSEEGAESSKPTLGSPKAIDFDALYPEYIRDLPQHSGMHYWIDYQGQVYMSMVDSPNDFQQDDNGLSWTADEEASGYTIYEAEGESAGASNKTILKTVGKLGAVASYVPDSYFKEKLYLISTTDAHNNTAAPVKTTYVGVEPPSPELTPEQETLVQDIRNIVVSANQNATFVVKEDGSLWSFGSNYYGQLGHSTNSGTFKPNPIPTKVMTDVKDVHSSAQHTLVIKGDNSLWAFGSNASGQLGVSTNSGNNVPNPTPLLVTSDVKSISAGNGFSLIIKEDGSLLTFGSNYSGQLGHTQNVGVGISNPLPTKIMDNVKLISAGASHSLVIKEDGTLWSFGRNNRGQLGHNTNAGTETPVSTPTQIMSEVRSASAGAVHSLVVKLDDSLWSFGNNDNGRLGHNNQTNNYTSLPTPRMILSNVDLAIASNSHSLVIKKDNSLWGFGVNKFGELGISTNVNTYNPNANPLQILTNVSHISSSGNHTAAIKEDGILLTFGRNDFGKIGNTVNMGYDFANATPFEVQFSND